MSNSDWVSELKKYEQPTHKMILQETESPCLPITRIGGAPWWPQGMERPQCKQGHLMTFVAQINLDDLPDSNCDVKGLCSFHYCIDCQYAGDMAFGWYYEKNKNYDIRILQNLESQNDNLGIVSGPSIPDRSVTIERVNEIPDISDLPLATSQKIPDEFCYFSPPDKNEHIVIPSDIVWPDLRHVHGSKIGGYPSWLQNPERPLSPDGKEMKFLAQLDALIGEDASWDGGAAFLFFHKSENEIYFAEMGLQLT